MKGTIVGRFLTFSALIGTTAATPLLQEGFTACSQAVDTVVCAATWTSSSSAAPQNVVENVDFFFFIFNNSSPMLRVQGGKTATTTFSTTGYENSVLSFNMQGGFYDPVDCSVHYSIDNGLSTVMVQNVTLNQCTNSMYCGSFNFFTVPVPGIDDTASVDIIIQANGNSDQFCYVDNIEVEAQLTASPTMAPTVSPTSSPTDPSVSPSLSPTKIPTSTPSSSPTLPSSSPTVEPTRARQPTTTPTETPVAAPDTAPASMIWVPAVAGVSASIIALLGLAVFVYRRKSDDGSSGDGDLPVARVAPSFITFQSKEGMATAQVISEAPEDTTTTTNDNTGRDLEEQVNEETSTTQQQETQEEETKEEEEVTPTEDEETLATPPPPTSTPTEQAGAVQPFNIPPSAPTEAQREALKERARSIPKEILETQPAEVKGPKAHYLDEVERGKVRSIFRPSAQYLSQFSVRSMRRAKKKDGANNSTKTTKEAVEDIDVEL